MSRSGLGTICGALCAALALVACGDDPELGETIDIGVLYSTTSPLAQYEVKYANSAVLAGDQINAQGGVLGKRLRIVAKDIRDDAEVTKQYVRELAEEKAVAVLGPVLAPYSLDAAPEAERLGLPMIAIQANTAFSPLRYVFNTTALEDQYATVISKRALAADQTRIAIVYDAPNSTAAAAMESQHTAFGGVVSSKHVVDADTDFPALLEEMFAANPDSVVLATLPAPATSLLNAFALRYPPSQTYWRLWGLLCTPDVENNVSSLDTLQVEAVSAHLTAGGELFDGFAEAYLKKFPADGVAAAALMFDAVYATALAVESAKSTDRAAVRDALISVARGGTVYAWTQFAEAVAALQRGEDIDYTGATDVWDWDDNGDLSPESAAFRTCFTAEQEIVTAGDPL